MENKRIPFLDLQRVNDSFEPELSEAIGRVVRSGWYLRGEALRRFERDYAGYCGTDYCVGVGSGLDALKGMKVYFYHTQDIAHIRKRMEAGEFPAHFLYGATGLPANGIEVVWHRSRPGLPRWRMMLRNAWLILTSRERFDAVYATHYRGLELIVLLRALRLFRRPVVIWHHQPVITSSGFLRERFGRLFYRGFDRMIFFSQKLIDDSLLSPKARPERLVLGHWGADLRFYDRVMAAGTHERTGFISTGKELRDMPTLVNAFNRAGARLDIRTNYRS